MLEKLNPDSIVTPFNNVEDYGAFAAARTRHLGEARPASTAILIRGLLKPAWKYQIEAVAAAPA